MKHKAKQRELNMGSEPMILAQETAVDYERQVLDAIKSEQAKQGVVTPDMFKLGGDTNMFDVKLL